MSCNTVMCENCWETTTIEQYESKEGCQHCQLGPNIELDGIQCDICERSFSHDCCWDNAYSKLIWKYGLEDHPVADEWTMMCPFCQDDPETREMYDQVADEIAIEYMRKNPDKFPIKG